jgi:hypothetical protein
MAQRLARNMLRDMLRASRASRAPDHRRNPHTVEPQNVRLPLTSREILQRHLPHERMIPSIFIAEIQDF